MHPPYKALREPSEDSLEGGAHVRLAGRELAVLSSVKAEVVAVFLGCLQFPCHQVCPLLLLTQLGLLQQAVRTMLPCNVPTWPEC